ncbi:hypothetical protein BS78_K290200 [Paspalum vaginatum]|uniref:Uncharacterized protein n=1 Tax=Paspalum vaginatum TaxID=158149 RepID=A0A9W8CDA7_9POAL|nr:hypothetical protein BS78_K290200 [Paspalum vaginatum]
MGGAGPPGRLHPRLRLLSTVSAALAEKGGTGKGDEVPPRGGTKYSRRGPIGGQRRGKGGGLFISSLRRRWCKLWDGSKLQKKFAQKDVDKFRKELVVDLICLEANEIQEAEDVVEGIMNQNN